MKPILKTLHEKLAFFLDSRLFETLFGLSLFVNPLAIFPQFVHVITEPSVAGVSIGMFIMFAMLQIFFVLYGIQKEDWRIVLALLLSFIQTVSIISIVVVKGGA